MALMWLGSDSFKASCAQDAFEAKQSKKMDATLAISRINLGLFIHHGELLEVNFDIKRVLCRFRTHLKMPKTQQWTMRLNRD
jgi:hypothetical protein